jgi:hypothetical protein
MAIEAATVSYKVKYQWTRVSKIKLGQAMEESRRSGRTFKRGDTIKIALGVQKNSQATKALHVHKKLLHHDNHKHRIACRKG